jgi:[acyl-carrier-protein] S-malonyltransferase
MTVALLCSGQGNQRPDMFDFVGNGPEAEALFLHASRWFDGDPRDWVRTSGEDALCENRNAQLLCTLNALAAFARLGPSLPQRRCVAGYSVGEVAAWHIAGRIGAIDTLDLIAARAAAMDAASAAGEGMLFVRGISREVLDGLCASRDAAIAIINPGDAYVLAGTRNALKALAGDAQASGATRIVPVPVRVASHTRRLSAAVPVFRGELDRVTISREQSGTRLFSGIDGTVVLNGSDGLDKLARQVAEPVNWAACMDACVEAGTTAFLELGPGRALSQMATDAYPSIPARSIADFRSWDAVHVWLARVDHR